MWFSSIHTHTHIRTENHTPLMLFSPILLRSTPCLFLLVFYVWWTWKTTWFSVLATRQQSLCGSCGCHCGSYARLVRSLTMWMPSVLRVVAIFISLPLLSVSRLQEVLHQIYIRVCVCVCACVILDSRPRCHLHIKRRHRRLATNCHSPREEERESATYISVSVVCLCLFVAKSHFHWRPPWRITVAQQLKRDSNNSILFSSLNCVNSPTTSSVNYICRIINNSVSLIWLANRLKMHYARICIYTYTYILVLVLAVCRQL